MSRASGQEAGLVRRALAGHAALGLLAAALLYVISLSGSLVVIHDRWQRWEQPDIAETQVLTPATAQAGIAAGLAADGGKPTTHLYLRMPTDDLPRGVVTTDNSAHYVDGDGRLAGREEHAWTEFVIGLHEYLNLPIIWGMMLVGALGVAMAALSVTGVLAHPRIVRDAFRLRTRQDPQVARADWHNRLGVWTLPFALALALTGAFIGLGSVGFQTLAGAYTGGDLEAAYAPVFGDEPAPDPAPAPLANVANALQTLRQREPDVVPTYVIVHEPGTRGQHVQIVAEHPRRLIYGETYTFHADGAWAGPVGLSDGMLGQQAAASTYNLHFGNYGGLAVELAYLLFGAALCVVVATGTSLWLCKRQRRGLPSERLRACWHIVVWGTPMLIALTAWLRAVAGADAALATFFWGGMVVLLATAAVRPRIVSAAAMRRALLLLLAITGLAHLIVFRPQDAGTIAIDGVLILGSLAATAALRDFPFAGRTVRFRRQGGTVPAAGE